MCGLLDGGQVGHCRQLSTLQTAIKRKGKYAMETKQCADCQETKAVSEFYKNDKRYNSYCKSCHKIRNNKRKPQDKEPPAHEKRTVAYLRSHGVFALHGKHIQLPQFKNVDIIAYSEIRVECKIPQKDGRIFFTPKQCATRYHADIVIIERDENLYSVFPITYAGFYSDGKLRRAIPIVELECEIYLNRVDILEAIFQRKRMALITQAMGTGEQLELLPKAS